MARQRRGGNPLEAFLYDAADRVNQQRQFGAANQAIQQQEEIAWFFGGFVAGCNQGFFLPAFLVLLFVYLKVQEAYMEKYVIGVLNGCVCYYFGWMFAICAVLVYFAVTKARNN